MKKIVSPLTLCFLVASCSSQPAEKTTNEATSTFCDGTCNAVSDCSNPNNECVTLTCISGMCGTAPVVQGASVSSQVFYDCQRVQCDGLGSTELVVDSSDLPLDNNPCTNDVCTAGVPSNPNLTLGTMCGSGLICDGNGSCVECVAATDCSVLSNECLSRTCNGNVCGTTNVSAGVVLSNQVAGDCQILECNGNGSTLSTIDNTDLPNDNNVCTDDLCTAGIPSHPNKTAETVCGANLVCDGNGNCVACVAAGDCPGIDNECQLRTCTGAMCGFSYTSSGTLTSSQTSFDCKKNVCNGSGSTVSQNDNTDLPVDGNQCTNDVCTAGVASNPNVAQGTVCNQNGGTICDGNGNCIVNVSNPILIAFDKFAYPIGSSINNQACPAGTCGGWQTTTRTAGTVCDGTQNSLGNSGSTWLLGPNANASKIVADFVSLPAGLVSVGNALNVDDRLLQNRLYRSINTAAGSPAAIAGLTGTTLNLAGNPFIELGTVWATYVSNEASPDTSSSYCGFHWNRGLGASSCFTSVKTNEVLIGGTNNTFNNYGFGRTTQGVSSLGPFYFNGTVLMNATPREYTIRMRFAAPEACAITDSNGSTSCPACPTAAPCHIGITMWIDAVPDANGDPSSAPDIAEKIMSNPSNIVGTQGGVDVLEVGCVGPSSNSQANNMIISHLGIAADDATHHGAFKKSRLE